MCVTVFVFCFARRQQDLIRATSVYRSELFKDLSRIPSPLSPILNGLGTFTISNLRKIQALNFEPSIPLFSCFVLPDSPHQRRFRLQPAPCAVDRDRLMIGRSPQLIAMRPRSANSRLSLIYMSLPTSIASDARLRGRSP